MSYFSSVFVCCALLRQLFLPFHLYYTLASDNVLMSMMTYLRCPSPCWHADFEVFDRLRKESCPDQAISVFITATSTCQTSLLPAHTKKECAELSQGCTLINLYSSVRDFFFFFPFGDPIAVCSLQTHLCEGIYSL